MSNDHLSAAGSFEPVPLVPPGRSRKVWISGGYSVESGLSIPLYSLYAHHVYNVCMDNLGKFPAATS